MIKPMTVRLDATKAEELAAVARVDEQSINSAATAAIDEHIQKRRSDPAFKARLAEIIEQDRDVLERLAR